MRTDSAWRAARGPRAALRRGSDPAGVGGTHVMYVLHHNDKPQIYDGLPEDPKISDVVRNWKGPAKPVGIAAVGLAAIGAAAMALFHRGNSVSQEDEAEARELVQEELRGAPVERPHDKGSA